MEDDTFTPDSIHSFKKWQESVNNPLPEDLDEYEPNMYRECAQKMLRLLHSAVATAAESDIKAWGVMFAIGHPFCIGKSMSEVATSLRVSRASISNAATEFCKAMNIPPSLYMKDEPKTKSK